MEGEKKEHWKEWRKKGTKEEEKREGRRKGLLLVPAEGV